MLPCPVLFAALLLSLCSPFSLFLRTHTGLLSLWWNCVNSFPGASIGAGNQPDIFQQNNTLMEKLKYIL